MLRMFNLNKWSRLEEGEGMQFHNPRPRQVRLDVNSPDRAVLYVLQKHPERDTSVDFLCKVDGREVVEFTSSGAFELTCEGGPVMVYTVDGEDISFGNLAPVIFTKIAERRKRSPELEYIAAMMSRNMERRLAQQADEFRGLFERSQAAVAQKPPVADDAANPQAVSGKDQDQGAVDAVGKTSRGRKDTGRRDDEG